MKIFDFTIVIFHTSEKETGRIMKKLGDIGATDTTIAFQFNHAYINFNREDENIGKALATAINDIIQIEVTHIDAILIDNENN